MTRFPIPPTDASVEEVRSWLLEHLPETVDPGTLILAHSKVFVPSEAGGSGTKCVLFYLPAPMCGVATARVLACVIVPTGKDLGEFQVLWGTNFDLDRDFGQCDSLVATCRQMLEDRAAARIDDDELLGGLLDQFVYAESHGYAYCWFPALKALPEQTRSDLLSYAEQHPEPRVFLPFTDEAAVKDALRAQARLVDLLKHPRLD